MHNYTINPSFADIDECLSGNNSCDVNADCSNTVGSYNCSCNIGYTGDGFNCTSKIVKQEYIVYCECESSSRY